VLVLTTMMKALAMTLGIAMSVVGGAAGRLNTRNWLVKTSFCHWTYRSNGMVHDEFIPQWMLCMWKASERSSV